MEPQRNDLSSVATVKQDKFSRLNLIIYLCGTLPVTWLALLIAPYLDAGLPGILANFSTIMNNPFQIQLCEDSFRTVLILLLAYGIGIGIYLSNDQNYRRREEHGSAKWGSPQAINKKYADKDPSRNKILTQNVAIGLDGRKHRRNLNIACVGGSGSGKTRFFVKPGIMSASSSFMILDPKGENLRDTGPVLEKEGYVIKVLDLINMELSHCYNPFRYIIDDNDIQRLTTNLYQSTTPKGSQSQEPFWDNAASMLLKAIIAYLHHEAPPSEQNFSMVMEMIRAGEVQEEGPNYPSVLDEIFDRLEMKNPNHVAVKYYLDYKTGAGKTLKSIQITLLSRLEKFNLPALASLTQTDEMELEKAGERKTAIYAIVPDNDPSFNFLVCVLYGQLMQLLSHQADFVYGGRLPIDFEFVMEEFANVATPAEFPKMIATMRSRGISVSIILQNVTQLKSLYEKDWESILGNCDTFLYLGGNEQSTHKYVSELLGKETIDTVRPERALSKVV